MYFHIGSKFTSFYRQVTFHPKVLHEILIQRLTMMGLGGFVIAWSISFFCARMQGELTYDQKLTFYILYAQIHHALKVREQAHLGNFSAQPMCIFLGIFKLYAEENQQPFSYFIMHLAVDDDLGLRNSLKEGAHISLKAGF